MAEKPILFWLPRATAPKDGKPFLGYCQRNGHDGYFRVIYWAQDEWYRECEIAGLLDEDQEDRSCFYSDWADAVDGEHGGFGDSPEPIKAWMPLPPAPDPADQPDGAKREDGSKWADEVANG